MKKRLLSVAFGALLALLTGEIFFSVLESSREADVRALNRIPEGESWLYTGGIFTPAAERAAFRGPTGNPHDFFVEHPELGFRLRPNLRALPGAKKRGGETLFEVAYSTNRFGWRVTPEAAGQADLTVFFGDSYMFGIGLGDRETLPSQFSLNSGKIALNFGVPGWGAQQAFRLLELGQETAALQGNRITHAYFLLTKEQFLQSKGQACLWSALCEAALAYFRGGQVDSYPLTAEGARDVAAKLTLVQALLQRKGLVSKLQVLLWNDGHPLMQQLEAALRERSLDVVPVSTLLPGFDGQPTAKTMNELAKALAQ